VYYVGIADSPLYTIQEEEVQNAGWYSFEDAQKRLTHEKARSLLAQVDEQLRKLE
jgi:NADH pyrophosphatase NudC (nudix superfamily)